MDAPRRNILVLHHSTGVEVGFLGDAIDAAGIPSTLVRLGDGDAVPQSRDWRAVVVLGGFIGAYEESRYPFLGAEKVFLASAVETGVPVLGICLGSQLLADALGGRAYGAPAPEAGLLEPAPTTAGVADVVYRTITGPVIISHGDTFELPPGATLLSATDRYPHAFRAGSALAVQFHPEAGAAMVRDWVERTGGGNIAAAGLDPDQLIDAVAADEDRLRRQALRFFDAWLATV